jgi:small GTP-binding protein
VKNQFSQQYKATIGADFLTKNIQKGEDILQLQIWDTAGTERYNSMGQNFYRNSEACVLVFDLTVEDSFSNIDKEEIKSSKRKENKNNNLINAKYIFDTLNNKQIIKKYQGNKDNNEIKKENNVQPCVIGNNINNNSTKIFYVREEYFYFGYLLARIEDKRNIIQIYFDLLEQCQIIFKFFFCPFNIYEDRKLQLIYYLFKINLYLVFNCLLISSSVINNIFDDNNTLADDLFRSCISSIYTYIIGIFIYSLTNLKQELIKRRYKLLNLRMPNQREVNEVLKITQSFYMNIFFNKLIKLYFISIVVFLISFFICFSFCGAYRYTQIYAFKGVLLSIYISQISPFALCWIPAILRRISMKKKNVKLYAVTKYIELLFVA